MSSANQQQLLTSGRLLSATKRTEKGSCSPYKSAKKTCKKSMLRSSRKSAVDNYSTLQQPAFKDQSNSLQKVKSSASIKDKPLTTKELETIPYDLDAVLAQSQLTDNIPAREIIHQINLRKNAFEEKNSSPLRVKQSAVSRDTYSSMTISHAKNETSPSYDRTASTHYTKSYISAGKDDYRTKSPARMQTLSNSVTEPSLIYLFRECFKDILVLEGSLEFIKKELASRSDFTLAGAFNMFTGYSQARISSSELLHGFEKLNIVCDISDAKLVIDRYDTD